MKTNRRIKRAIALKMCKNAIKRQLAARAKRMTDIMIRGRDKPGIMRRMVFGIRSVEAYRTVVPRDAS